MRPLSYRLEAQSSEDELVTGTEGGHGTDSMDSGIWRFSPGCDLGTPVAMTQPGFPPLWRRGRMPGKVAARTEESASALASVRAPLQQGPFSPWCDCLDPSSLFSVR